MGDFPEYKKVSTDSLIPYARNSRTHSEEQVSKIAASIKEFGFLNPVIIDGDSGIVAGHGRVMAAQKLGIEQVPTMMTEHLPKSYKRNGVKDCICEDCGGEFWVRKDTKPKCCRRCTSARGGRAVKGLIRSEKLQCKECSGLFRPTKESHVFCSVKCRTKNKTIVRECKNCQKEFGILTSTIRGTTNASGNFCCRPCYENYLCSTERVTGRGSRWKKHRDEAIRRFPFCAKCGTTKNLQVHHIIPFRLTFDNSQKNLVPLCVKHHKEIEMMFVDTERFGMDKVTKFIWLVMIRGMQQVTATRIKTILGEHRKNATKPEGLAHG